MADDGFRLKDVEIDKDDLASVASDATKATFPDSHEEFETSSTLDIPGVKRESSSGSSFEPTTFSSESVAPAESVGVNNGYTPSDSKSKDDSMGSRPEYSSREENQLSDSSSNRHKKQEEESNQEQVNSGGTENNTSKAPAAQKPNNDTQSVIAPTGGNNQSVVAPTAGNVNKNNQGQNPGQNQNKGKALPIGGQSKQPVNNQGSGPDGEKTSQDKKKEEKQRADENNANNIRNAAKVAQQTGNPYAVAAGKAVEIADKVSGGKSTEFLGKTVTQANKMAPGGRMVQNASNKLNESGASDMVGKAADAKGGKAGASQAGSKASSASNASKAGSSTKKSVPKKDGLNKGGSGGGSSSDRGGNGNLSDSFMSSLGDAIKTYFLTHPFSLVVVLLIIFLALLLLLDNDVLTGNSNGNHKYCSYELKGVTTNGTVKLDNVQVELVNCDAQQGNYTVLETIDFEKYVIGVALAETSWDPDNPEYFKAQIIAARGFALTRNSGMCPSNPDDCFFGYNAESGKIRLRACTNDQVYCDPDKPCYHVTRSGQPTIYGPEAEGMSGATVWKSQLSEEEKAAVYEAAEDVKGKVLVDSSGNVVSTNFVNTDQQKWNEMAKEGKEAEDIIQEYYADKGATGYNSATCSNYGSIDYGDYVLNTDDCTILNQRLDTFLESKGTSLEEFNQLIVSNVEKNGYGTRAGVVTAAVTLIAELGNNYGVKVPYFLSGGHHDGVKTGAVGYWGSGTEDDGRTCYYTGYGNVYTVCGLDCSGFVPWAIKNGGFQVGVNLAGNFQNLDGAKRVSLSSSSAVLEPGDLLESEGHIVLVVGVDESTSQYICAEASGKSEGVQFTRRPYTGGSGYWGVKMDGYYEKYSLKGK